MMANSSRMAHGWTLELRPRDPILVRDARPFAADPGARAVTLDWPLPVTIAGALRTHVGNTLGVDWDQGGPDAVREIAVQGPFLLRRAEEGAPRVYFPAPRDAVPYRTDDDEPALLRLRPIPPGALPASAGCDLWPGLWPVRVEREVKPPPGAVFWSAPETVAWLGDGRATEPPRDTRGRLPTDVRTHIRIEPDTQTAAEGALFSTEALAFDPRESETAAAPAEAMVCRLTGPSGWSPAPAFIRVGGEGRQVAIAPVGEADPWPQPDAALLAKLTRTHFLRVQLVTPGLFARAWSDPPDGAPAPPGWLPEWIDPHTLRGRPPRWRGPEWTLVSAVIGRRVPLSGWDMTYRDATTGQRGRPKRTRYAVPAGSVYFFELPAPLSVDEAASLWLRAVSDRGYDRRNGFGLVLPGIWEAWQKEAGL